MPDYIKITNPKNNMYKRLLETYVDAGEASVIALASELNKALMILDDNKARKLAKTLKLEFTGTLGVLIIAKKRDIINSVSPLLKDIQLTDFRLDNKIIIKVKQLTNEL